MKLDTFEGKLALFPENSGPVFIDFTAGKKKHRLQFGGGKGQPLARAVGIQGNEPPFILDATAGMGGDSFVFASLGCRVQMIERSQTVAALLQDALERASQDEEISQITQRMQLVHADAADWIANHCRQMEAKPDTIYLDPMYPEKKKAAAAKKEMQALQQLVGPDLDSEKLLDAALKCAVKRVVVKRPAKALAIAHAIQPSSEVNSPNTRYDIYSISALKASGKL